MSSGNLGRSARRKTAASSELDEESPRVETSGSRVQLTENDNEKSTRRENVLGTHRVVAVIADEGVPR